MDLERKTVPHIITLIIVNKHWAVIMKDTGERKRVIYSVSPAFPVGFLPSEPSLEFI